MARRLTRAASLAWLAAAFLASSPAYAQQPETDDPPPQILPGGGATEAEPDEGDAPAEQPSPDQIVDSFEGDRPRWRQETTDAAVRLRVHERTDQTAYDANRSEHFQFVAGPGSYFFYSFALPRVPLTADLQASLYVKANRPGIQFLARVVLPADIDPDSGQPYFVTVAGTTYQETDRWSRLELSDLVRAAERQVWVLRSKTRRQVRMEGAYLERLVLNLYSGPGESDICVDSLRVAPVTAEVIDEWSKLAAADAPPAEPVDEHAPDDQQHGSDRVHLLRNRLTRYDDPTRRHYPWIPTIIHAPGADITSLRRHGFDVYAARAGEDLAILQDAATNGFLLMPMLGRTPDDPAVSDLVAPEEVDSGPPPDEVARQIQTFSLRDSVAFWHLDDGLGQSPVAVQRREQLERSRAIVSRLRDTQQPGLNRLTTATVSGDLPLFAKRPGQLDIIGVRMPTWGSMTSPLEFIEFLEQRQRLTALINPDGLYWAWIPTTAPDVFSEAIWGLENPPGWGRPTVQPEQLRLMTYAALAGGCRAIAYEGDAELTREPGQLRLLELALLNAEIDLFESIFAQGSGPITKLPVYPAIDKSRINQPSYRGTRTKVDEARPIYSARAVSFQTPDRRGTLLMVADFDLNGMTQPGQMATQEIRIIVPGHQSATAWEVSLAGIKYLPRERVPGGLEITLQSFGPTAMVLITSDLALKDRLEREVMGFRGMSVDLALQQAEAQLQAVAEVHGRLVNDGHDVTDSARQLKDASDKLVEARAARDRGDFLASWESSRRVGRPLRIIMKQHQDAALKDLKNATVFAQDDPKTKLRVEPVSSPPLTSFNTLPQQFIWTDALRTYSMGPNLLPGGEFEEMDPKAFRSEGWTSVGYEVPELRTTIENVADKVNDARGSARMLHLAIRPADPGAVDRLPPFQDHPIVAIQSPPIAVQKHQFLRISALVLCPRRTIDGAGGFIMRDSIGGPLLQFRQAAALNDWTRVVLYRRAPDDGEFTVTLGLASTYGDLYIDDLRVERATQSSFETPAPETESAPDEGEDPVASSNPGNPALPDASLPVPR